MGMKIKYLGPSKKVNIPPFGEHLQHQVKTYPDDFAKDLLATSKKQQFKKVGKNKPSKGQTGSGREGWYSDGGDYSPRACCVARRWSQGHGPINDALKCKMSCDAPGGAPIHPHAIAR